MQVQNLFEIPVIYNVDISSDGSVILYSSNSTGVFHLYALEKTSKHEPRRITTGDYPVVFGFLSPKGNNVIFFQDVENELSHLFLASIDKRKTKQLTKSPCRTWGGAWHPCGKEFVRSFVAGESCGLEIFNVKTNENFVLKEQKSPFIDVKYSHDGKWIAGTEWASDREARNLRVTVLSRSDPDDTISYRLKDGSKEMNPSWSHNDRKLAFLSNAKGKNQVVIQNFQSEERSFLSLDEREEAAEDQDIGWSLNDTKVYYIVTKYSRSCIFEHPINGKGTLLPFPRGTIWAFKISENEKKVVAVHSSMASPDVIYVYKTDCRIVTPITPQECSVKLGQFAKPKSVWYRSSNGLKIHAWYLLAGLGTPPYPAVVWCRRYRSPWMQTYDRWDPYLQSLSQCGFAVLAPNFRGSTGYGAEFRNMNLSDPGGGDLDDIVAAGEWLSRQPEIDRSKISVMGASYGGFLTLMALAKKPEVFAAGVALRPITDWIDQYKLDDAGLRKLDEELFGGPPEKKGPLYCDRSLINHVHRVSAPVLLSCDQRSLSLSTHPVEKFAEKLKKMHSSNKLIVTQTERHGFPRANTAVLEVEAAVQHLKNTLFTRQI